MNAFRIAHNVSRSLFAACALSLSGFAAAANVVYQDVDFFESKGSNSEAFQINSAGIYKATLTDFKFPSSFSGNFALGVVSGGNEMVGSTAGPGSFTFQATVGTYWASVFGVTAGSLDLGLYGIRIEQLSGQVSAVPLPAGMLLLASGLVVLFGAGRGGARIAPRGFSAEAMA